MSEKEDAHAQSMAQLTDEDRRALAAFVHGVFANPNADPADVIEAYIGYLTLHNTIIYTASGELGVHLSVAVESLRKSYKPPRRFLGMPRSED